MGKPHWVGLAALLGATGVSLALAQQPEPPRPKPPQTGRPPAQTLADRLAQSTKLPKKDVETFLKAIGPAIRDQLRGGSEADLPGLGMFRIVGVPSHRDLVDGRPATVGGENFVEFIPSGDLKSAANSGAAQPAEVVPPFQYIIIPGQAASQHVPSGRAPNTRTR